MSQPYLRHERTDHSLVCRTVGIASLVGIAVILAYSRSGTARFLC